MAALTPTYLSGYLGIIEVDGTPVKFINGTFDDEADDWDAGNASTAGFSHPERGQRRASGSFEIPLVAADDLPTFVVGLAYATEFYSQTGQGWTFGALITKKSTKMDQKGGTMMTVNYKSQGIITEVNPA